MTGAQKAHPTRPVRHDERLVLERFVDAIVEQSRLMDAVARQLLVVELAVPGLYATMLKLISGKERLALSLAVHLAFACWLLALVFSLRAMLPRPYHNVRRDSPSSIEEFFDRAARYKRRWLLASITTFVTGLLFVVLDIMQ